MTLNRRLRPSSLLATAVVLALSSGAWLPSAHAAEPQSAPTPVVNSDLDAPLLYQILLGELELNNGQPGTAYEVILDAARRTRSEQLFRRAVDIALQSRAGEQALSATKAWRTAQPQSLDAARMEVQLLAALNRLTDAAAPLRSLIQLTPADERAGIIAALPRAVQRAEDQKRAATLLDEVLAPYRSDKLLMVPSLVASGRAWLSAGDADRALGQARAAQQADRTSTAPPALALELMVRKPEAETLVTEYLKSAKPEPALRLAYARTLTSAQRYVDAIGQLDIVAREQPTLAPPLLTLGALQLELRHFAEAEVALKRYLALVKDSAAAAPAATAAKTTDSDDDDDDAEKPDQGAVEARLLLARSAEQRGDFAASESWLAQIDDPQRAIEVQTRRATLLARQGRIKEAREIVRRAPERKPEDARAKLVAEANVLREVKRWGDAYGVLADANKQFPDDADLIYEQAMVAEKMQRMDDAERLLRRVIEVKPDNAHAHNALGYSLAERGVRLPEARKLIQRALELSPGDPFITDSLGWVEYRLGNLPEAARLLRLAHASRPDAEIGAHLGEVLWAMGERDEAQRVWREAQKRDGSNEALRETLARLKVKL
jgi:tetratricopeptide (TPR) repeat protein